MSPACKVCNPMRLNIFYSYKISCSMSWMQPHVRGEAPSPRHEHASAQMGRMMYVFGGAHGFACLNDLHRLDTCKRHRFKSNSPLLLSLTSFCSDLEMVSRGADWSSPNFSSRSLHVGSILVFVGFWRTRVWFVSPVLE